MTNLVDITDMIINLLKSFDRFRGDVHTISVHAAGQSVNAVLRNTGHLTPFSTQNFVVGHRVNICSALNVEQVVVGS